MKPNAIVPRGPIKSSLIGHWEKLVFGCAVLASLCLLGNALSHSVYPETPARLMQKAEDVEARIERSTPPVTFSDLPPPRALSAMLQNTIAAIEPERFPMRELARPYADLKVRRKQPALLAAQDVKAFSGFGAIAISDRDLGRERGEVRGGQVTIVVLDEMEVFDQQVATARPVEQQRADFLKGVEIDLASLGGPVWPATAAFAWHTRRRALRWG